MIINKIESVDELAKNREIVEKCMAIMSKISELERLSMLHKEILKISKFSFFESSKIVDLVIANVLLSDNPENKSNIRLDALDILSLSNITSFNPKLFFGLYKCLDDPDKEVVDQALEELHIQLESLKDVVLEKPDFLETFLYEDQAILPKIAKRLLDFFEDVNEKTQLLALKALDDLLTCLPIVIFDFANIKGQITHNYSGKFEDLLLGSLKNVIRKLVSIYLSINESLFKENLHKSLLIIKEKNPKSIFIEAIESKSGGMLKRWDYLNAILNIP